MDTLKNDACYPNSLHFHLCLPVAGKAAKSPSYLPAFEVEFPACKANFSVFEDDLSALENNLPNLEGNIPVLETTLVLEDYLSG